MKYRSRRRPGRPTLAFAAPGAEDRVFCAWRDATGHQRAQLTEERRQLVRDRLADGLTEEELCEAILAVASSAWHRGGNPKGRTYDSLELCLRSEAQVRGYLERRREQQEPRLRGEGGVTRTLAASADSGAPRRTLAAAVREGGTWTRKTT